MSAAQRPVPESEALSRLELLTTSEREVLRLLGEGLAAQEIADRVVRGKCTIETHIRNIGRKIGWRGQQRLTRLAMLAASRGDSEGAGRRDPEVVQALRETIAAHARSRGALEQVMSATADVTGEAFLEALAVSLGRALGVRLVAIVETMPTAPSTPTADTAEMLRSVAWSLDGELFPRVELRLFDSALAGLGPRDERFIADDASTVLRHDPLVQRVGARSVLAMPLRDGDGGLLGGVILMHDEAIDSSRSPEFIVRLFGGRAASELERRATDHRLRESELRYRMLAENSGDVIGRFSATGTRLYASPSSEAVFGWRPEELVGHSGYELIHTEDIERVGKTHRESLANPGVPQRVRWRARRRDGTLLWVESVVRATMNPMTRELEMLVVTRDIDAEQAALDRLDRINAELEARVRERTLALESSEQRWRSTLESANDHICIVDRDLRLVFCNRGTPGMDPAKVIGTPVEEYIAPESREAALAAMRRVLESGEPQPMTLDSLTPDGRRTWSSRFSPITVDGRIVGLSSISRDITVERRIEDSLRDSERRYRKLVELAPDGILVHDGTTILFANPAAAHIFGYPVADAMVGESVMSIVPEHRREAIRERIDSILRDRTNAPRMEQVLLRRDGSTVHAESSATWCTFKDVPCVQALIRERPPHEAVGGHAPSASAVNGAAHHAAKMDAVEGR